MITLPSLVEIEINSACNLSCSYCPNSVGKRVEQGHMSEATFQKIINDLAKYNYRGKISFEFYNEPTLSPNLIIFTSYIKEKLPLTTVELYSNALKIDSLEKFTELEDSGIDRFIITKHENVSNFQFESVYSQLSQIQRDKVEYKIHTEVEKYNRAGILKGILRDHAQVTSMRCRVPSRVLTISVDGNIISCFEDFYQKYTFENVNEGNIIELWNFGSSLKFRNDLENGERDLYETCKKCNRFEEMTSNTNKHLIDETEVEAVARIIRAGDFYRYQNKKTECDLFEEEFSAFLGCKSCTLVTSGTNAIVAALMALGIGLGDEVIIPSYTYVATATAILSLGAIPVVVDVKNNLMIDVEEIEKAITKNTKAIIPVHMDGLQSDIIEIMELARKKSLFVVEDVAQALGASFKGKKLGTYGDIGCFSFNQDKTITCGEGGAVVTSNPLYTERLRLVTDHGFSFNPLNKEKNTQVSPFMGLSMRVSNILGALLRVQLTKVEKIIEENKRRKLILIDELKKTKSYGISFNIVKALDYDGECGSCLHLNFISPDIAAIMSKKMMLGNFYAIPLTTRNAHCSWKWGKFLERGNAYNSKNDPWLNDSSDISNKNRRKIQSMLCLSSTLRYQIDITQSEEETKKIARFVVKIVEETFERL